MRSARKETSRLFIIRGNFPERITSVKILIAIEEFWDLKLLYAFNIETSDYRKW